VSEGYRVGAVLFGEVITTFAMVTLLCVFLGSRRIVRSRQQSSKFCTP
jgi:hypothetical protein